MPIIRPLSVTNVLILAASFVGYSTAASPRSPQASKFVAQLPEGNAKSIIVAKCQLCHNLARVVISHRPKDEWDYLVDTMIERGAPVTPDEKPIIVDYLFANFGPKPLDPSGLPSTSSSQGVQVSASVPVVDPDHAQFSLVPDSMGLTDIKMSAVSGDPLKTGLVSILLRIPAGQEIPLRFFSGDQDIVCLRGSIQLSEGDAVSPSNARVLNPGTILHLGAQMHVSAQAKDSTTVVLVYGEGPLATAVSK